MDSPTSDSSEQIDRKTGWSICDAIGKRLQQSLLPDSSNLTARLQHLMDELRRRDRDDRRKPQS